MNEHLPEIAVDGLLSKGDRLSYAAVLVEIGELKDAELQVAQVLEEDPGELTALDLLAKIKHIRGELSEAIGCWAHVQAHTVHIHSALLRLSSMLQLARDTEHGAGDFLVLGPFQLWRKPAAHIELEEMFKLFLGRRPGEARARCDQLAAKYRGRDAELYKLAILAKAWISELSGELEMAQSVLEELGKERGFETDGDRAIALARLYERSGKPELLERAVHIYQHFLAAEPSFEKVSMLGHLASLHRRLGRQAEAGDYGRRFLSIFRRRMHRPTAAEMLKIASRCYLPLYKLGRYQFPAAAALPRAAPGRAQALALALSGDRGAARAILAAGKDVLDLKYLADLSVLEGNEEEAIQLYLRSLRREPPGDRWVLEWLLLPHESPASAQIREYFRRPENAEMVQADLEASLRAAPLRWVLWRQLAVVHSILGREAEASRCAERAEALQLAAERDRQPVGRVLAAAVYQFSGKSRGLIHEVWAGRKPSGPGRGGFLDEILGNLTPEMSQAVRNTFLSVREYARAKWPHQTRDIMDYNYTYKVTKEDEPSGGLSAGLPSALAFLSVFLDRPVPQNLASSGVLIADSHDVLFLRQVGDAEYKVRGAYNRNLDRIILPEGNRRDLQGSPLVPDAVSAEIARYASNLDEAVRLTFGEDIWFS